MGSRPRVILDRVTFFATGVKNSIVVDTADMLIQLSGDEDTPGINQVYGTDGSGTKGWKADSSTTIPDGSITNAKLVNEVEATIKGRASGAGTGVPQDLTAAQVKTILAYAATEISNTPAGGISATTVQAAVNELDAEKQPLDTDLTQIAAIVASNDDLIQRKAGVWTNRTPTQVKTDLVLVKADVGLGNVDNTSDVNKPVSTAQATADALHVLKSGDSMTGPLAMGTNKVTGLSDGTNPADAVNKAQLDAVAALLPSLTVLFKIVDIGPWNMDTTTAVTIPHGISGGVNKILAVTANIYTDAGGSPVFDLVGTSIAGTAGGRIIRTTTTLVLERATGGFFDSNTDFDSTASTRGQLFISYQP